MLRDFEKQIISVYGNGNRTNGFVSTISQCVRYTYEKRRYRVNNPSLLENKTSHEKYAKRTFLYHFKNNYNFVQNLQL